jgi:hypothetical protein
VTISQLVDAVIDLSVLESQNLLDVVDLRVLRKRLPASLSDVEQLSAQRKHAIVVSADNRQPRDRKRFGRVSFREDQSAISCIPGTGVVRIFELRNADEPFTATSVYVRVIDRYE